MIDQNVDVDYVEITVSDTPAPEFVSADLIADPSVDPNAPVNNPDTVEQGSVGRVPRLTIFFLSLVYSSFVS